VPPEQRNFFYRGFNAVYNRVEAAYGRLMGHLVAHSNLSVIFALILIGVAGYGLSRVPTGFIPIEDQGYLLVAVQLPDGAALDRTQQVLNQVSEIAGKSPGVDQVISIAGISALDSSSSLANAGVAYLILKEWSARGPGQDLRSLFVGLNEKMSVIQEARILVVPPPPIQGIGNAAGLRCRCNSVTAMPTMASCRPSPAPSFPMRRRKARCSVSARRSARWCRNSTSRSTGSRPRRCM